MVLNPKPNEKSEQLLINGKPIKEVKNFKYLGANMSSTAFDVNCRKGQAWSAFWQLEKIWRAKHLHLSLKLDIYKTAVLSVLLYSCETCLLNQQPELS